MNPSEPPTVKRRLGPACEPATDPFVFDANDALVPAQARFVQVLDSEDADAQAPAEGHRDERESNSPAFVLPAVIAPEQSRFAPAPDDGDANADARSAAEGEHNERGADVHGTTVQPVDAAVNAILSRTMATQAAAPLQLSRLVEELGASLQVSARTRAGCWHIRLVLKENILPHTVLQMASDGYRLTARFETEDVAVERLLRAQREALARALEHRSRLAIVVEIERVDRLT